ncbi:sensor histidine kinase [Aquisalimonas lutea]|uniref:sensor histidine kinase n=1 Tax=Aquisalimonas lutea TaxID=1327750 RepID=UPI0025B35C47|nr:sensor histidine kinase [Aquisalimonas lutea]MDN3518504.1 sensor histidine kinase [Aquisalimonas lutea]
MKRRLLWKLCATVAAGTVAFFWAISLLSSHAEDQMSYLAEEHQATLLEYGNTAKTLYESGDQAALSRWLRELQDRENTWAAVARTGIEPVAGSELAPSLQDGFRLGRGVDWKVHLYFDDNPIMEVPIDQHTHFLIKLPQRMRPGTYLAQTGLLIQIALPLLALSGLSVALYRHLMRPLRNLESATREFSRGQLDVRVRPLLGNRNDELSSLAETFDHMAKRTGELIRMQRHLIAALSHELRTPLTRIDMALECAENSNDPHVTTLPRVRRECAVMRRLVEDTLTLAWLDTEQPRLDQDTLNLTDLIDSILEDARFEYPDHELRAALPDEAVVHGSCQRALGQALENVIRNALQHTPAGGSVGVDVSDDGESFRVEVADEGPGVPEDQREAIFEPFARLERVARDDAQGGHGLGLALARREIRAVGGSIHATNRSPHGLVITIQLPKNAPGGPSVDGEPA